MSITFVLDATHLNIGAIPPNTLAALYTTGSPDIQATATDFANHPNAIHICQDHGSDTMADILDSELGAATPEDCAVWVPKARASFHANIRANQRWPGLYASLSKLPPIANALDAAKITNVPLWVAEWGLPQATAVADLLNASGPFPVVGMQIKNQGADDFSVFSTEWISKVSTPPVPTPPIPSSLSTINIQSGWLWCNKCQGLFHDSGQSNSHCPVGGMHDGTNSFRYALPYIG